MRGDADTMRTVTVDDCLPARVHGVHLADRGSCSVPKGGTVTLAEWKAQQGTVREATVIHRSGCSTVGCDCAEGRPASAGQVRMFRDETGGVRFVHAHYRQPNPGELAVDVDGCRFKVSDREKQL